MPSRNQYVAVETATSMAINAVLSIGFVFLVFHGRAVIQMTGAHGVVLDMVPQTFMVVLMSCLVPALVTRKRHAAGALTWHASRHPAEVRVPLAGIFLRAVVFGLVATAVVLAASWIVLPHLFAAGVAFRSLLIAKAIFGTLLAAIATPWAINRVLRD